MTSLVKIFKEKGLLASLSFGLFVLWLVLVLSSIESVDFQYILNLTVVLVSFLTLAYSSVSNHSKSVQISLFALIVMIVGLYFESVGDDKTTTVFPILSGFVIIYYGLINYFNVKKR